MLKKYALLIITVSFGIQLVAQTKPKSGTAQVWDSKGRNAENWDSKRWSVGLQTGLLSFHGDLSENRHSNNYRGAINDLPYKFNGGIVAKYAVSHVLSVRGSAYFGKFVFNNNNLPYANYNFDITNKIQSYEAQMVFNMGNLSFLQKDRKLHLSLFTGIGQIRTKLSGTLIGVDAGHPDINFANDPYWKTQTKNHYLTVPVGIGLMYNINKNFDIGIESGLRYTRTDSLDFANANTFRNRVFDRFSQHTVGVYYKFGSKKETHYDWINPLATLYDDVAETKRKLRLLTGDADKDGVADYLDKEPETPEGVKVDGGGVALDIDMDGIPDYKDDEQFSDKGQPVDEKGKMKDADNDGVPDSRDLEPNTPKTNMVNFQGKTIPTSDYIDPITGKRIQNFGGNSGGGAIGYLPTIYFDTDKWYVKPEFYGELLAVSEIMRLNPSLKLDVVGNADYRLDDKHNDMLGNNRANAVIDILVKKFGVDKSRLNVKNNGEHIPMVPGKGPAFDPYNRRVNFFVAGTNTNFVK